MRAMFLGTEGRAIISEMDEGSAPNAMAVVICLEFEESVPLIYGNAAICGVDSEGAFRDLSDERIRMFTDILKEGNIKNLKVIEA